MTVKAQVNRSLHTKSSEKFYVTFFKLPENISNILGREVQMSTRPNVSFNESEIFNKSKKWSQKERVDYQPIDVTFIDDMESLINHALYSQIKRQTYVTPTTNGEYMFEMLIKIYSANSEIVETILLKHCRIQSINHSEQIYTDSTNNITTVTIAFNELDYSFPVLET